MSPAFSRAFLISAILSSVAFIRIVFAALILRLRPAMLTRTLRAALCFFVFPWGVGAFAAARTTLLFFFGAAKTTFTGRCAPAVCRGAAACVSPLFLPTGSGLATVGSTRVLASCVIVPGLVLPPPSFVMFVGSSILRVPFLPPPRLRVVAASVPPTSRICLIFGSDILTKYGIQIECRHVHALF